MEPRLKAIELVNKFAKLPEEGSLMWYLSFEIAKKCALISVDEILKDYEEFPYKIQAGKEHWIEVKEEIEKLSTNTTSPYTQNK